MLRRRLLLALTLALAACGGTPRPEPTPVAVAPRDPDGPHRVAVAAQVQPFLDAELTPALVIGLYDQGKREVYGFGRAGTGPDAATPTGTTLFEIGSITKVFTALLLADAAQAKQVELDQPLADLLPPGVPAPTLAGAAITLRQLALHSAGLPRLPPSLIPRAADPDPYAGYGEDALYADLVATALQDPPGTRIVYSNFGAGLLGHVLGKKLGGGYAQALTTRVLRPLGLASTYLGFPPGAPRAQGTSDDLQPVPPWTFDALAGAGALVSNAQDMLALIDAELDAVAGSTKPLRAPMRLTQETQLDQAGENVGLGWQVDALGRYWHNGGTGGYHAFVGFDPRTRRGVVILAASATSVLDRLARPLYMILDGAQVTPLVMPAAADLAALAGTYDFLKDRLAVVARGRRLYIEGPGEPRQRLLPMSNREFLLEGLQALVAFERDEGQPATAPAARMVFTVRGQRLVATRVP